MLTSFLKCDTINRLSMKTRLVLLASYFFLTPIFILAIAFYANFVYVQKNLTSNNIGFVRPISEIAINLPTETSVVVAHGEARVDVLREFFDRYNSPLAQYSDLIVKKADEYGLDYRLLPAIAMQESTLCLKAPKNTNNCWGFGIYGKKRTAFDDYGQAIAIISKAMAENYHGKGLIEPAQIMTKYTPSNNGVWAENVSYVMDRIALASAN